MPRSESVDFNWRAVRIATLRDDGFVEFDFFVGNPDIYAEMILPKAAFAEFCAEQGVEPSLPGTSISAHDGLGFTLREAVQRAANISDQGPDHAA